MKRKLIGAMIAASMIGGTSVPALAKTTDNTKGNIVTKNNYKIASSKKSCNNSAGNLGFTIGQVGSNAIKDCVQNIINNCKPSNPDNENSNNGQDNIVDDSVNNNKDDVADNNNTGNNQDNAADNNTNNNEDNITNDNNSENNQDNIVNDNLGTNTPDTDNNNSSNENVIPPTVNESEENFMAQVEQLIYQKVNEERAKAGLSQLSYNSTMEKYARIKSKDMGDNNYFSHEDLSGKLITEKMKQDGVSYRAWGENIAYIGGVSDANKLAEQFMTNWMNSSGHRANILSANFESIGMGVYKSGNRVYATQEFYK